MPELFVVMRSHGSLWDPSRSMEDQADWNAHAVVMNDLEKKSFVLFGGPLDETEEVLLIVRAVDPDDIRSCLSADPWTQKDILPITRIARWSLRLGCIG